MDGTGLIDLLLRAAEKNGGKLLGIVADSAAKLRKHLEVNFSNYFETTIARCSNVTTLFDRGKAIPLHSIYVTTRLEISRAKLSDEEFRTAIVSLPDKDSMRIFLVIGTAGRGKTFLLRWLFLTLLENESSKIPFYIELRGINHQEKVDLLMYLYETITNQRAQLSLDLFKSGMEDGSYVLVLDGLDEVERTKRDILARQLVALQDHCPSLTIVISSRPDENLNSWSKARRYLVLPMNKKEAVSLIRKLPYKSDVKKKFAAEVASTLYDQHRSFLSNPLLVTIMLLTYADIGNVPSKMHIFYEQAFETLFYRHDTWKEAGYQRRHYSSLAINEFRDCLSSFCVSSYRKSQIDFTTAAALDLIEIAARFERITVVAADFLADLEESVCILVLDGLTHTFAHRSFQEYFAALFISRGPPIDLKLLLDALSSRRSDAVLPMALDMNRSLIERDWVLPRLTEVTRLGAGECSTLELLQRAGITISYDGSLGRFGGVVVGQESSSRQLDFLLALQQLYPSFSGGGLINSVFSEQDNQALKEEWDKIRNSVWAKVQEAPFDSRQLSASRSDLKAYVEYVLVQGFYSDGFSGLTGPREQSQERFIRLSNRCFEAWRKDKWLLTVEDESWLSSTSYYSELLAIRRDLVALQESLSLSTARARQIGTELLDFGSSQRGA